jgi:RHS repeat-associated protein
MKFNGSVSTSDALSTTDGLGRTIFGQKRQNQTTSSFDTTQTTYTWNSTGVVTTQSVPYSGTAAETAPGGTAVTTTQHDALGRPLTVVDGGGGTTTYSYTQNDVLVTLSPAPSGENVKQRQLEYDGLGRLTSVCEVTPGTTAWPGGNCAQTNPLTGYWTTYTYDALGNLLTVTENAQGTSQTRTYGPYDGLSRLTSETNPESGTTTYTYDTDATCGTSKGDLVKRVDANGNTICYTYDALHRNTSTTFSGPNATTNRYYVYDSATVNGQAMANAKGRMAEGYTATSSTGTKVTDEGFSYDVRGELANFYESTSHSAGYYSVPLTYWANGQLETFGPFLTDSQVSVAPDGEGRPYTITGASSSVPTINYNHASQPTQIMTSCEGGTCYPINYSYDSNTLRMTKYAAALSTGTVSGTLTWNPNGSLRKLAIVDPTNSANVQTCAYSADDLSRISSVSCNSGSTWGQTFTYDAFGNLTKSVPTGATGVSWQPGYSSSTNRYTLGGTSYDANGNVLNDSFNTYTWDAEGKTLSTDYVSTGGEAFTFTYDAFGHKVEWLANGAYEASYVYIGNIRLSATGQTAGYSEFPLPGGSVLSQGGGNTGVQMADWLGTIRTFISYTGGIEASSSAHAPFGESYASTSGSPQSFTGQLNDGSTNTTYYFSERQLRSSQGRWLSPDPSGVSAEDPTNPQSWNRYAYAVNNPLSFVDPLGLQIHPNTCTGGYSWGACMGGDNPTGWDEFEVLTLPVVLPGSNATWDGNVCYGCVKGFALGGADGRGGICLYALSNPCGSTAPNNGTATCFPTKSLNWSQKAQLTAAQFYAGLTGWTFGFGVGGDAGAGVGSPNSSWNFGAGGSASTLIVADGSGNSGFLNSVSGGFSAVKMSGAGSWWGAGAAAGPSFLVSPNPISTIAGPSGSVSAGGGAVLGAGISVTTSGAATFTFGVGAGAEAGVSPQFGTSQFSPFCHN